MSSSSSPRSDGGQSRLFLDSSRTGEELDQPVKRAKLTHESSNHDTTPTLTVHNAELLVKRMCSARENIVPEGRIPKLSKLALAVLPSPCAHMTVSERGHNREEARLMYTIPFNDISKILPRSDLPSWKTKQYDPLSAAGKPVEQSQQASFVPWVPFRDIPKVRPEKVSDLPAPRYRRYKWSFPYQDGRTAHTGSRLSASFKSIHIQLSNWCLNKLQYTTAQIGAAMDLCHLDLYIPDAQPASEATYDICLDVFWGEATSSIDNWTPRIKDVDGFLLCRGISCEPYYQSVTFYGPSRRSPEQLVAHINHELWPNARVVDLWQEYAAFRPNDKTAETYHPLPGYNAVIILLEASRENGNRVNMQERPSHDPVQTFAKMPNPIKIKMSSNWTATLNWPS